MSKHGSQKRRAPKAPIASGGAKKARVEVTFEGATPSSTAPPSILRAPSPEKENGNGKGKARALDAPTASSTGPTTASAASWIVIAGSYEKLLYGIEGTFPISPVHGKGKGKQADPLKSSEHGAASMEPIFIFPAHLACVKAVAASPGGKWLATGSEDEFVKVWDLRRRKEVGSLSQHVGSITSLHFPSSSHLVSTSDDGTISLFRCSDWALLKSLKGHSGRVNHVDVHPTGRVGLSVGKDKTLRMWDLMRGRGAASLPLSQEAEQVKFSPRGTHFAVLYPKKIEIYSLTLKLLHTLETKSRFNTLSFTLLPLPVNAPEEEEEKEVLCVGTEKGITEIYAVEVLPAEEQAEEDGEDEAEGTFEGKGASVQLLGSLVGHTNRVKSISSLLHPDSQGEPTVLLSSVSSDGLINVYDLHAFATPSAAGQTEVSPIGSYDTKGSRLTCVALAEGRKAGTKTNGSLTPAIANDPEGEEEDADEDEDDEAEDPYEQQGSDDGDEADGVEVEFEDDEEEEEEEEEGEEE